MSIRTTVEIDHDYEPGVNDASLLAWAKQMQTFLDGGNPRDLPVGVTRKWSRHHSEGEPTRDALLLRAITEAVLPLLIRASGTSVGLIGQATRKRADVLAAAALHAVRACEP